MSRCAISISEPVIMGGANIHLDDVALRNTKTFLHILESSGLQQHMCEPTHHLGHILDVIISRDTRSILTDVEVVMFQRLQPPVVELSVLQGSETWSHPISFHRSRKANNNNNM